MKPEKIKYLLRSLKKPLYLADVARSCDKPVTPAAVSAIVRGTGRSGKIEKALADALNMSLEKLFPEYYPVNAG